MSLGFATAFNEITLVLFTTLAPSGAVAYALMSLPIVKGGLADDAHRRIDKALAIPLVVALVGLVASATHLGNPANALYVFMGAGRSPLSNEVLCAVFFLAFSGVYWLYSFALKPNRTLQRVLAAGACVGAVVCVTAIAFAYSAHTIVSWDTVYAPLSLWTNVLLGGPLLAIVGLRAARWKSRGNRYGRAMLLLASAALAACAVVYALQGLALPGMENAFGTAADRVPYYAGMVAAFAVLAAVGIGIDALSLARGRAAGDGRDASAVGDGRVVGAPEGGGGAVGNGRDASAPALASGGCDDEMTISVPRASVAAAIAFAGIFVMRFSFYMMHMTAGISL